MRSLMPGRCPDNPNFSHDTPEAAKQRFLRSKWSNYPSEELDFFDETVEGERLSDSAGFLSVLYLSLDMVHPYETIAF